MPMAAAEALPPSKPPLTLDLDGVLAQPPLGWNVALSRRLDLPPPPATVRRVAVTTRGQRRYWLLRAGLELLRYSGRRPRPGVQAALADLSQVRTLGVLSGRCWVVRPLVRRWLERHGLSPYLAALWLNDTPLPSAQFKLWVLQRQGVHEHVDDDGGTAAYLARHGVTVYLCDWPRNRGLPYPPGVERVRDLREVAWRLRTAAPAP